MTEYPRLTLTNAKHAYEVLARSEDPDWSCLVPNHEVFVGRYESVRSGVQALLERSPNDPSASDLRAFEADLGIVLHQRIPWGPYTGDKDFWRWIAFVLLREAVVYRHGKHGMPERKNYGIGALADNLAFRSWFRADIAYDQSALPTSEECYDWAKVGDQDFWRSFIIRVRYSYARQMAKALLEFQHPNKDSRRRLKPGDKETGIRMLSKRLSRLQPNLCLAALDKEECLELLSELAEGLELEGGGTYSNVGVT